MRPGFFVWLVKAADFAVITQLLQSVRGKVDSTEKFSSSA